MVDGDSREQAEALMLEASPLLPRYQEETAQAEDLGSLVSAAANDLLKVARRHGIQEGVQS